MTEAVQLVTPEAETWADPHSDEPVACACPGAGAPHGQLSALLTVADGSTTKCRWRTARIAPANEPRLATAACVLADGIMRWRTRGAATNYRRWRDAVNAKTKLEGDARKSVVPFVKTVFGLEDAPRSEDHLRGWIAEYIWFRTAAELPVPDTRALVRMEGPSFHANEPGGDGLAVWRLADDSEPLHFCLWEIKSYSGSGSVSPTVRGAYDQMDVRALTYLAQMTSIEAVAADEELGPLYAALVDLWVDGDPRCAAGIAVSTHDRRVPARCFTTMPKYFPALTSDWQLEGLIAGIGDYTAFCREVRRRVWIAL